MFIVLIMFGYMIWGVCYILASLLQSCLTNKNNEHDSVLFGLAVVDILIIILFANGGFLGFLIGLLICVLFNAYLIDSFNKINDPQEKQKIVQKIQKQDKYDNNWGIINYDKKK